MTKLLTLYELLKMNPHLDRAEIERTLKTLGQTPARPRPERASAPDRLRVGDAVPPLELSRLDGSGAVRLDGFSGRPLLLIFGSYT